MALIYNSLRRNWGEGVSTSYGTVVENIYVGVIAFTRNNQHSEDLASILRSFIESLEIFEPNQKPHLTAKPLHVFTANQHDRYMTLKLCKN